MGRAHDEADRLINVGAGRASVIIGLQEFEGRAAFKKDADEQEVRTDVRRLLSYMRGNGVLDGATDRDLEIFARFDTLSEANVTP
ncbi:hypothetical protein WDZ92_49735 [Nostoc sp. NIES-2111]